MINDVASVLNPAHDGPLNATDEASGRLPAPTPEHVATVGSPPPARMIDKVSWERTDMPCSEPWPLTSRRSDLGSNASKSKPWLMRAATSAVRSTRPTAHRRTTHRRRLVCVFPDRRGLAVLAFVLVAVAVACSSPESHSTAPTSISFKSGGSTSPNAEPAESAAQLAADAYVWGYPLVVTERTLQSLARLVPENRLTFQPALTNVSSRTIVSPNADTLYAVAPLDLRSEPYVLTLPAIHSRYYSFQLLSAYTDSFAYIGTRATGGRAGRWGITPPGWRGHLPRGITQITSLTPQLLLLGRFAATDDADVARVHAIARHVLLEPLSMVTGTTPALPPPPFGRPAGTPQSVAAAGIGFFDQLGDALAINPPTDPVERRTLQRFAELGIGIGRHPSTQVHDTRIRAALSMGVRLGAADIAAAAGTSGDSIDGWTINLHIGTYGHNALLRAAVAETGWGANVPAEAVYAHTRTDVTGTPLSGAHRYRLHFSGSELPPVKAFWSITMYGPDLFFVASPIDRYAIGSDTTGLQYGSDGSLDLYVQHDPPRGHESNWLPAPTGPFVLTMRLYVPETEVLEGRYHYPPIEQTPP